MKLDAFLKLFVPNDNSFFPLFEEDAKILLRASGLLRNLMAATPDEREAITRQIKEVEHEGDETTHRIYQQLNKSFITPFDREDVHALAGVTQAELVHRRKLQKRRIEIADVGHPAPTR